MDAMTAVTPNKDAVFGEEEGAAHHHDEMACCPSTIRRDIQRHESAADAMIGSIQRLYTPPQPSSSLLSDYSAQAAIHTDFHDDDGELCDEIQRLPSVINDIRKDLRNVIGASKTSSSWRVDPDGTRTSAEEHRGLVLFVMFAFWIIVYAKEWMGYAGLQLRCT